MCFQAKKINLGFLYSVKYLKDLENWKIKKLYMDMFLAGKLCLYTIPQGEGNSRHIGPLLTGLS